MANPESAEKMQIVVDSLRANPDVVVVGGFERNYLETGEWPSSHSMGGWSHTLDIYTHPKDPIYKADELNDFMNSLVPELEPTCADHFRGGGRKDRELSLGKLYFDEHIGMAALTATVQLLDSDLSIVRAGVQPSWVANKVLDLRQRTWVRVFPDGGHLADAAEGENEYHIPVKELGKRGVGHVVADLFHVPMLGGVIEAEASPAAELEA